MRKLLRELGVIKGRPAPTTPAPISPLAKTDRNAFIDEQKRIAITNLQRKFCSSCGEVLIAKISTNGYDDLTGEEKVSIYAACPKRVGDPYACGHTDKHLKTIRVPRAT